MAKENLLNFQSVETSYKTKEDFMGLVELRPTNESFLNLEFSPSVFFLLSTNFVQPTRSNLRFALHKTQSQWVTKRYRYRSIYWFGQYEKSLSIGIG